MTRLPKGLNKVMVIGWLDADPELRHTPGGRAVVSFSVGTAPLGRTTDVRADDDTEWFNVVAWGSLAERCGQELAEGRQVYVEGRLQTRSWEDGQGRKHYRTEVVASDVVLLADPHS